MLLQWRGGTRGRSLVARSYHCADDEPCSLSRRMPAVMVSVVCRLMRSLVAETLGWVGTSTACFWQAALAAVSASSLPRIPAWPGTHTRLTRPPAVRMVVMRCTLSLGGWLFDSVCRAALESVRRSVLGEAMRMACCSPVERATSSACSALAPSLMPVNPAVLCVTKAAPARWEVVFTELTV